MFPVRERAHPSRMSVDEFLRTATRPEVEGALWAEKHLTPVLNARDRIRLQQALERMK